MGGQVELIVSAGILAQRKGLHKPPQRQTAERVLALADTGLQKGRIKRRKVHRAARREALPHPVALALNAVVEDMGGGVLVQKFGILGVEQPCAVQLHGNVCADGPQQLFQPGGGVRCGTQAEHLQAAAVGEQVTAKAFHRRTKADAAQFAAVVKGCAVQHPHGVGQGDLLHKVAGDFVGVASGAVCARLDGLVRKAVGADFHHGHPLHAGGHGRAGGIPQYPQHPRPAGTRLPTNRHQTQHPLYIRDIIA